ncbi:MAG: ATP-dependent Clp protease ATP-binding subunit [Patescibacteria group bacterium]
MDFIYCPKCDGSGYSADKKICLVCRRAGLYAWAGGFLVYFRRAYMGWQIWLFHIKRVVVFLIEAILFLYGLVGLLAILKFFLRFDAPWLNNINFFGLIDLNHNQQSLLIIFWLSIITDCFLYYSLTRKSEEKRKIWPKTVRSIPNLPATWEEIERLSRKIKINATDALSQEAEQMFLKAMGLARKMGHDHLMPIHLFAVSFSVSKVNLALMRLGFDWSKMQTKISTALSKLPVQNKILTVPIISKETKEVFVQAYGLASDKKIKEIDSLQILESLSVQEGPVKDILYDFSVAVDDIRNVVVWIEIYNQLYQEWKRFAGLARFKPKSGMNRAMTAVATPNLDLYSQDLTLSARAGYFKICIDREKEQDSILRAIEGGGCGVVLVGQPGVGRTTIINGLARRMATEDMPKVFQDKRLVSLNISDLIAGASQSGEIEQRLQFILSEINRSGNIILFISNIQNIVGVKTTQGELDISEILADAIKKRLLIVLATTTPNDYTRVIENRSLGEVLQKINIEEPDKNTTIQILEANVANIESKEQVYFSYSAIKQAYILSTRYIYDRFLPDKAINLLNEASVFVRNKRGKQNVVVAEDLSALVAEKTNIPLTKLTESESEKLLDIEERIHERIIGQDEAVKMVAAALRRARTELRNPKKPITNLLFLGPTGVGKTELAKTVASVYFGDENKMIRLDMSEYQDKASIYRLIGVPGSGESGYFIEAVRQNPFSLVLLDEIEKAHPDILNVFLQVMDDGRLTDALGRTIDFTNVVLIATSNAGSIFIQESTRNNMPFAELRKKLLEEKLNEYFRPEFLNRFDGVIVFKPLTQIEIKQIASLLVKGTAKQLAEKGITLKVTDVALEELAQLGFDPIFGARPLKRVIQEKINDSLAKFLLAGQIGRRDTAILDKGGVITIEKGEVF